MATNLNDPSIEDASRVFPSFLRHHHRHHLCFFLRATAGKQTAGPVSGQCGQTSTEKETRKTGLNVVHTASRGCAAGPLDHSTAFAPASRCHNGHPGPTQAYLVRIFSAPCRRRAPATFTTAPPLPARPHNPVSQQPPWRSHTEQPHRSRRWCRRPRAWRR